MAEGDVSRHALPHGEIIHARVEDVYPTIAPGSVTLAMVLWSCYMGNMRCP